MVKNILFDFDGVILDSMPIREYGFRKIFSSFTETQIDALLEFHNKNGGLSRYVKIRYFYEVILKKSIPEEKVTALANEFSNIMKKELIKKEYLIEDTIAFIENSAKKYNLHIVSGSDEKELHYLCKALEIDQYFLSIHGSPTHKNDLVKNLLKETKYSHTETILIGDSINDYEASKINNIDFYGFNNKNLISCSKNYIENLVSYYRIIDGKPYRNI